jgi:CubicO group peptidase (beta-lactamase class C family)
MKNPSARFGSSMVPDIGPHLQQLVDTGVSPGVTAEIRGRNRRILGAAGQNRGEKLVSSAQFPVGCSIKIMTAILCLELADRGDLDLDSRIVDLIPELAQGQQRTGVKVHHLLTHTSGIREPVLGAVNRSFSWSEFCSASNAMLPGCAPGEVWSFSHTGYVLLGEVVSRVARTPLFELVEHRFLRPLREWRSAVRPGERLQRAIGHRLLRQGKGFSPIEDPPALGVLETTTSNVLWTLAELIEFLRYVATGLSAAFPDSLSTGVHERVHAHAIELPPAICHELAETVWTSFGMGLGRNGNTIGWTSTVSGTTTSVRMNLLDGTAVALGLTSSSAPVCDNLITRLLGVASGRSEPTAASGNSIAVSFDLRELVGLYFPLTPTGVAWVAAGDDENELVVTMAITRDVKATAILRRSGNGHLTIKSAPPSFSFALARSPSADRPVLLLSKCAYTKEAAPAATMSQDRLPS